MSRCRVVVAFVLGTAVAVGLGAAQETKKEKQKAATPATKQKAAAPEAADRKADEAAIRAGVKTFLEAYNGHDAKAIAELFAPNARIVTEDDEVIEGREAIEQVFAAVFADDPKTQIEATIGSIKFIGSDLALEVGSTKTTSATLYSVLSVAPGWDWTTMSGQYPAVDVYAEQLRALEAFAKASAKAPEGHFLLGYHYRIAGHSEEAAAQFE